MRRKKNGDQKGDDLPLGEESIITRPSSHLLTIMVADTTLFTLGKSEDGKEARKEDINKKIREWDLKLIQGKISEEEYLMKLNEISSSQD
ncbi:MAG: hypothetical protein KAS16_06665 [Thermoplasmata archaeon]|nr:hypothetical protein [Thermoplasmata archaeon]